MIAAVQYKLTSASISPLEVRRQEPVTDRSILVKTDHHLEILIKQFILNKQSVETFVQSRLDKLFRLRITCLNWLAQNPQQWGDSEADLAMLLRKFEKNSRFLYLHQNILFAIQMNIQGIEHFMPNQNAFPSADFENWQPIPQQSLQSFLNLMRFSALPFDFSLYQAWLIASLQMEFGVMATLLIHEKNLSIEDSKINELAVFVAYAAQNFGDISKQMKRVADRRQYPSMPHLKDNNSFFEDTLAGTLDESPFDFNHVLENHTIVWENLPLVQSLFEGAPFEEMAKSLTP